MKPMERPDSPLRAPAFSTQVAERWQGRPFGPESATKDATTAECPAWVRPPALDHFPPEADPR
jgi:hypothetical protein